ncbi:hypothetical protein AB0G67_40195 [Streptomyces sp. NPDC021056]|uniref:hypothetical protein n=1 Tax=Streptomyces sp. NPDC021056 TaxID=3155012 RepID=UPI0033CA981D
MSEHTTYVDELATQLRTERPDVLRAAEDELQRLRRLFGAVTRYIHNPAHDHTARAALARDLGLPAPIREPSRTRNSASEPG